MLGYVAGWHRDFDGKHAAILNRMVMLYALPLNLFASMMGIPRHQILGQGTLAIAIFIGMVGTYAIVFVVTRFLCGRDLMSSSLQALAIGGPAAPFIGVPVQESLFLLGQSTGGVALFASGIVLFSRRVAISLPTGISVLIRNIIVRPRLGPFFWARASSLRQREKPCSPSRCRRRRSV